MSKINTNFGEFIDPVAASQVSLPRLSGGTPGGRSKEQIWAEHLGAANPINKSFQGSDVVSTHQDLYHAYEGSNLFLRDTITGFILDRIEWFTSVLPWLETDEMSIQFSRFEFKNTLAGPVPNEGIPRLMGSSNSSFREQIHRLGIGFQMEGDLLGTDAGTIAYQRNIAGISQCCLETINLSTIVRLLMCKRFEQERTSVNRPDSGVTVSQEDMEVQYFGCMSVNREDFTVLVEMTANRMRSPNVGAEPDTLILWPNFPEFKDLVQQGTLTQYYATGADGRRFLNEGPIAPGTFHGMVVYKTREFDAYSRPVPFQPLDSDCTFGEYYPSVFGPLRSMSLSGKGYNSDWRSLYIYDYTKDDWAKVSFLAMFKQLCLFGGDRQRPDELSPEVHRLAAYYNERYAVEWNTEAARYRPENLEALENNESDAAAGRKMLMMLAHNFNTKRVEPLSPASTTFCSRPRRRSTPCSSTRA
jgi:hypothetical protein